ncbi:hypothetical protein RFM98_22740 [Mesorhizobium sp. VK9D]|uniref:hypothetical protein n=1 Tax=Mesorhizobium australafricanum TaxID=3072311 RepID=UPI002A24E75F|nr:hypothetical protein [Mesorhizobium sp. VK9D]MDX8455554.1 hypothetical protein [Mesorhizobium sp. VK9D]
METYGEVVWGLVDWVTSKSDAILVLSATLPLALLLREGRLIACSVVGVFVGAFMSIVFGIEGVVAAVLVILASSLLLSTVLLSTRKRLAQVEDRVASVASAIDNLEIVEERRQTFSTRRTPNSRLLRRLQSATGAAEQAASADAGAGPGKRMLAFPDMYSPEPGPADLRPKFAAPASTRSVQRNPTFSEARGKVALELNNSAGDGSTPLGRQKKSSQ